MAERQRMDQRDWSPLHCWRLSLAHRVTVGHLNWSVSGHQRDVHQHLSLSLRDVDAHGCFSQDWKTKNECLPWQCCTLLCLLVFFFSVSTIRGGIFEGSKWCRWLTTADHTVQFLPHTSSSSGQELSSPVSYKRTFPHNTTALWVTREGVLLWNTLGQKFTQETALCVPCETSTFGCVWFGVFTKPAFFCLNSSKYTVAFFVLFGLKR